MKTNPMGSRDPDRITAKEAATILNVSVKMVHHMTRRGLLSATSRRESGRVVQYYDLREVSAAASVPAEGLDIPKIANIAMRALAISRSNERKIQEMAFLLGLEAPALETTEEEVLATYIRAQDLLKQEDYQPDSKEVLDWAKVFFALTEEYLALVRSYTGSNEPWKVFYDLGVKLTERRPAHLFATNKSLEVAYAHLEASRRHLRALSYFMLRTLAGPAVAARAFPELEGGIDEEVIRLLFVH